MTKRLVIPTVFESNEAKFNEKLSKIESLFKFIQIDFMDGNFVKTRGINLSSLPNLLNFQDRYFEAHLMVSQPEKWIHGLREKGFKKVIFHYESVKDLFECKKLIKKIKDSGMIPFIALNPSTKALELKSILDYVPGVLVMGVNPGKEKQGLILTTYKKIRELNKMKKNLIVQVDGGVNPKNASKLREAGADIINSGSYISESKNPIKAWEELYTNFVTI